MDDKIDFYNDINKYSTNIIKNYDINTKLDLQQYNDNNIVKLLLKWKSCFEFLGKNPLFISKPIQKIIYCILSDCSIINYINKTLTNLSLYDELQQDFWGFDVVININSIIKIKLFNVCDRMVIMDCTKYPIYKIYHLYNLSMIKDLYKTSKINFDIIKRDMCLVPMFVSNINNLFNDFKKLSASNFNMNLKRNMMFVESYVKRVKVLEDQILKVQNELFDMYNKKLKK
jgi:hypothetical protein